MAVVRDAPKAARREEDHLRIPVLIRSPVLIAGVTTSERHLDARARTPVTPEAF
jgi:hypothetical protein